MESRYHKAAKDGLLDVLKEATRKEVNAKDVDGMTPVLWAAFEGKIDALRLLVGRGGDPDKSDQFGNSALHLCAAKGHMNCVDFLIKFGVNVYALDIDNHSAKDLAAINNRDDILRYLDAATSNIETTDRKRAKSMKEAAQKQSEKRAKEYAKTQQQQIVQELDNDMMTTSTSTMPHRPSTVLTAWKQRFWSGSQGNLKQQHQQTQNNNYQNSKDTITSNTTKFSALVGGTISGNKGAVQRKANQVQKNKQHQQQLNNNQQNGENNDNGEFKVGEIEAGSGKRSVRSLQGVRRDSEVLYVGTFNSINGGNIGKRGKITDVFDVEGGDEYDGDGNNQKEQYGTLARCFSQPDFLSMSNDDDIKDEVILQRPAGLFDRPMLGSLAFPRSVTAALSQFNPDGSSFDSSNSDKKQQQIQQQQKRIKPRSQLVISDSDSEESSSETDDQEDNSNPLERFLAAWGLEEHTHIFQKQQIDLDTLLLLTESDLKSLNLPLGPFRKLVVAIQERKNALSNPGPITDSRL